MGRLDGKVAIITGAARGQGEAAARLFVAEGARVVLGDLLDDDGRRVARDLGEAAVYTRLDVSKEADWSQAVTLAEQRFGMLNVLLNNAGILRFGTIEEMSLDDYMSVITVNQVGTFLGMRAAIPALKAAGGGSIVNISSIAGIRGMIGLVGYVASKSAICGMTRVAAMELGHSKIRVNCILPGGINTVMGAPPGSNSVSSFAHLPIPRIGEPDEVARLSVFLASEESSYCTGADFVIDGGYSAGVSISRPQ